MMIYFLCLFLAFYNKSFHYHFITLLMSLIFMIAEDVKHSDLPHSKKSGGSIHSVHVTQLGNSYSIQHLLKSGLVKLFQLSMGPAVFDKLTWCIAFI